MLNTVITAEILEPNSRFNRGYRLLYCEKVSSDTEAIEFIVSRGIGDPPIFLVERLPMGGLRFI